MPSNTEVVENYVAETELTASNTFAPENVGAYEFIRCLLAVIRASQQMDKFKKALFRKRTREESELPPMELQPTLADVLGNYTEELKDLFHGVVGNITEVGEQAEIIYGLASGITETPDIANVREEIGDNLWYLARLVKFAKTSFPTEMKANIEKLRLRHGTAGFSKEGDINRNLAYEHAIFEGNDDLEHPAEGLADHPDEVKS